MKIAVYCSSLYPDYLLALERDEVFIFNIPGFLFSEKKANKIAKAITDLLPKGHTLGWFKYG